MYTKRLSMFVAGLVASMTMALSSAAETGGAQAGSVPPAPQALDGKLTMNMSYAALRRVVLAHGWKPLFDPYCSVNSGARLPICRELEEVEACSGDGYCTMYFVQGTQVLRVGTYGDSRRWNTPGEEQAFQVRSWEFPALPPRPNLPATACTAAGYWDFFQAFVRAPKVRLAYTAPRVERYRLAATGKPDEPIQADARDRFAIALIDNQWAYAPAWDSGRKIERLDVTRKVSGKRFRVDYVTTEFDANDRPLRRYGQPGAYEFEMRNGCWYLVREWKS